MAGEQFEEDEPHAEELAPVQKVVALNPALAQFVGTLDDHSESQLDATVICSYPRIPEKTGVIHGTAPPLGVVYTLRQRGVAVNDASAQASEQLTFVFCAASSAHAASGSIIARPGYAALVGKT